MGPALDPRFLDWILAEDLGAGDATTEAVVPADAVTVADVLAKADGVLCGIEVFEPLLRRLDPAGRVEVLVRDGATVAPGQRLATIRGRARAVLSTERTALNVARHLSGIATLTAAFVAAVAGLPTTIHDTRKTLPGWRVLDKYAVRVGGAHNHRAALDGGVLIKDNHLAAGGGITETVRRARALGLSAEALA